LPYGSLRRRTETHGSARRPGVLPLVHNPRGRSSPSPTNPAAKGPSTPGQSALAYPTSGAVVRLSMRIPTRNLPLRSKRIVELLLTQGVSVTAGTRHPAERTRMWNSFKTVLEAHADEEERDLIPAPASLQISGAELDALGEKMAARIEKLRHSTIHRLRVKGKTALLEQSRPLSQRPTDCNTTVGWPRPRPINPVKFPVPEDLSARPCNGGGQTRCETRRGRKGLDLGGRVIRCDVGGQRCDRIEYFVGCPLGHSGGGQ
jgi:hypothetical protein